jgi:hypothetical protein
MPRVRLAAIAALSTASCVQSFSGSQIELFLHSGVQLPGDNPPGNGRPPSDTHFEMYVARGATALKLLEFDLRPVITQANKCFIEDEHSRFPGLHSTMIVDKMTKDALLDGTVTPLEAGDIALAQTRLGSMAGLENTIKVIVSHESGLTDAMIAAEMAAVPDPSLDDDASNAARLAACNAIFDAHPAYFVGTDKVLSIPLNGTYYGVVEGMDPRSGSPLGGGSVIVNASFPVFDSLRINWNFNDPNDPRKANYSPSDVGWHYMAGTPFVRERGVINVSLRNQDFGQIAGEASIYTNLDQDGVQF